jgi:putative endonuclease
MKKTKSLGNQGEALAVDFLKQSGYNILELNWTTGHKEIDIIAQLEDIYIFIEVKTRSSNRMGHPEESISPKKIEAVTEAARIYLYDKTYKDIRFDVIAILLQKDNATEIMHFKDAFY